MDVEAEVASAALRLRSIDLTVPYTPGIKGAPCLGCGKGSCRSPFCKACLNKDAWSKLLPETKDAIRAVYAKPLNDQGPTLSALSAIVKKELQTDEITSQLSNIALVMSTSQSAMEKKSQDLHVALGTINNLGGFQALPSPSTPTYPGIRITEVRSVTPSNQDSTSDVEDLKSVVEELSDRVNTLTSLVEKLVEVKKIPQTPVSREPVKPSIAANVFSTVSGLVFPSSTAAVVEPADRS